MNLRDITMHRAVSRAHGGHDPMTPALRQIERVRNRLTRYYRARNNWQEEEPYARRVEGQRGPGAAYDAGLLTGPPTPIPLEYVCRRLTEALAMEGLPEDLAALCREFLSDAAAGTATIA